MSQFPQIQFPLGRKPHTPVEEPPTPVTCHDDEDLNADGFCFCKSGLVRAADGVSCIPAKSSSGNGLVYIGVAALAVAGLVVATRRSA